MGEPARACRGPSTQPRRGPLRISGRAAVRCLGLDPNPLCRTIDRVEAWTRLAAAAAVLLALPLTLSLGSDLHDELAGIAAGQASSPQRQVATVIEAPVRVGGRSAATARASVSWRDPAGEDHVATAEVPIGAQRGDDVEIWTSSGTGTATPTREPFTRGDAVAVAVLAAALLHLLAASGAWLALRAVVGAIDRRRHRDWDIAWSRLDTGQSR